MVRHTIEQDNDEVIPSEVERTLLLLLGIGYLDYFLVHWVEFERVFCTFWLSTDSLSDLPPRRGTSKLPHFDNVMDDSV